MSRALITLPSYLSFLIPVNFSNETRLTFIVQLLLAFIMDVDAKKGTKIYSNYARNLWP